MKLIAFDIDGTSINQFKRPTKKTLKTLQTLHSAGYILVPTTGRCLEEIPKEFIMLNIIPFAITSNGARIVDLKTNEVLYDRSIPTYKLNNLLEAMGKDFWMASLHLDNSVYDSHSILRYARRVIFHRDLNTTKKINNLSEFIRKAEGRIEKVQLLSYSKGALNRLIHNLKLVHEFEYPLSRRNYLEVTDKGVDKLSALQELCTILKVNLDDVIAIGDDMNDLLMLKASGYSIAMGNAGTMVKSVADTVTLSNRENGFYHAFKNFFPELINF